MSHLLVIAATVETSIGVVTRVVMLNVVETIGAMDRVMTIASVVRMSVSLVGIAIRAREYRGFEIRRMPGLWGYRR